MNETALSQSGCSVVQRAHPAVFQIVEGMFTVLAAGIRAFIQVIGDFQMQNSADIAK
jgi:hypothetical protein